MAIAPRFTPSIGNVGSMPTPKAQADNSTATAFAVLGKAFGDAANVAEKVAAKQEAFSTAAAAHQANLWRAADEDGFAKFTQKPFDPSKVQEDEYVTNDRTAEFRAKLPEDQAVIFDRLVEADKIKRQTRITSYAHKETTKQSITAIGLQIEEAKITASQTGDLVVLQDLVGKQANLLNLNEEAATIAKRNAVSEARYNQIKTAKDTGNHRVVADLFQKYKSDGTLGIRLEDAIHITADSVAEVEADDREGLLYRSDADGNIDPGATLSALNESTASIKSKAVVDKLNQRIENGIRADVEQRKAIGSDLIDDYHNRVKTLENMPPDANGNTSTVRAQLDLWLSMPSTGEKLKRMLPEQRRMLAETLASPTTGNPQDETAAKTLLSGMNNGDPKATETIAKLDINGGVWSTTTRQQLIDAKVKIQNGEINDIQTKKKAAISSALLTQIGIKAPDYVKIWKDKSQSEDEKAEIDRYNNIVNTIYEESLKATPDTKAEDLVNRMKATISVADGGVFFAESRRVEMFEAEKEWVDRYSAEEIAAAKAATKGTGVSRIQGINARLELERARRKRAEAKEVEEIAAQSLPLGL